MATVTYEDTRLPPERARQKPSRRRVVIWFVIVALLLGLVGGGLVRLRSVPVQGDRRFLREPGAAADPGCGRARRGGADATFPEWDRHTDRGARGHGVA